MVSKGRSNGVTPLGQLSSLPSMRVRNLQYGGDTLQGLNHL